MPIAGASEKFPAEVWDNGGALFNVAHPDYAGGASNTGAADARAAFVALEAARTSGFAREGIYRFASNTTLTKAWTLAPGTVFKPDAGVTVTIDGPFHGQFTKHFDLSNAGAAVVFGPNSTVKSVLPEWWGAKPDSGTTDCTLPIKNALTCAPNRAITVEILPSGGYYATTAPILVFGDKYSGVTIKGHGFKSWIRKTTNHGGGGTDGIITFQADNTLGYLWDIRCEDFRISGNSGTLDLAKVLRFDACNRTVVKGIFLENVSREGIYFSGPASCTDALIEGCFATNIGKGSSLSAYNINCNRARLVGCMAYDVGQFVEHTGYDLTITGNVFIKASFFGITIHSTSSSFTDLTGSGIQGGGGIGATFSQRSVVSGNAISQCQRGVYVGDASTARGQIVIEANMLHLCERGIWTGASTAASYPILIQGNLLYDSPTGNAGAIELGTGATTVQGNTFFKGPTSAWAFLVRELVDEYVVVRDNTCYGIAWTTAAYWVGGTKATVKDNVFEPMGAALNGAQELLRVGSSSAASQSLLASDVNAGEPFTWSGSQWSRFGVPSLPTKHTWKVGDRFEFSLGGTNASMTGAACTTAGTAGTLNAGATTGGITTGTALLTVNSITGLYPGAKITIAGVTGIKTVLSIAGLVVTLDSNASATVAGAAVAYSAPVFTYFGARVGSSADNGDANATLSAVTSAPTQRWDTALTSNRTVTLPADAVSFNGQRYRIVRTGLGAFTLTVQDAAAAALKAMPASTAAWVDAEFNGTNWKLAGYGTL